MERVTLVAGPVDRRIDEAQVEVRVVPDQDRALATVLLHRRPDRGEDVVQRVALDLGQPERVIQDDAGDLQRLGIDLQAFGRHHMGAGGLPGIEQAVLVHFDRHRGDFQQRMAI